MTFYSPLYDVMILSQYLAEQGQRGKTITNIDQQEIGRCEEL